jgi:hypothetical protein
MFLQCIALDQSYSNTYDTVYKYKFRQKKALQYPVVRGRWTEKKSMEEKNNVKFCHFIDFVLWIGRVLGINQQRLGGRLLVRRICPNPAVRWLNMVG